MQLKTRETGVSAKDQLTVDAHRKLGYAQHGDVLAWDVFQEQQQQMIREIEAMSGEELCEVIAEAYSNEEDDALPLTSEEHSLDEAPAQLVDDRQEHDDGRADVPVDGEDVPTYTEAVQGTEDDSTSVPVGHQTTHIPLIKVNFT